MSAESGIPTFRDAGGLWERYPVEQVASPGGFASDPALVWRFYSERRRQARNCAPNPGHRALAALEQRLGDRFLLATQNVDGLHRRAGSERLVEIHGNLFRTRCSRCSRPPFPDEAEYVGRALPTCSGVRPGRAQRACCAPTSSGSARCSTPPTSSASRRFMAEARRLVFLAAGTSGAVWPAAGLVSTARAHGATTWLVNAEAAENVALFDHFVRGRSGEVLPVLLGTA